MRTVPNMHILNLAVSDIIILALNFYYAFADRFPGIWPEHEILCVFLPFIYRLSTGLSAYSNALYSIQRYRVTVNPLQFHVSSQPTWRATVATICLLWIVAALLAIPEARLNYLFRGSTNLLHINYYQLLTVYHLLVSCAFALCVIAFCYMMTSRQLFQTSRPISEETQNPQLNTRRNTAKDLLGLTVVLLINTVPVPICEMYFYFSVNPEDSVNKLKYLFDLGHKLKDFTSFYQNFLSFISCLSTVEMFRKSLAFRSHFKRYLTCCCKTNSPPTDLELANIN
jgi:gastrin-releasing peptide receptor